MKIARPDLSAEIQSHFNEPVLVFFQLARCVGYAEDEDDCYMVIHRPNPYNDTIWWSLCTGYVFLDCLKNQRIMQDADGNTCTDFSLLDGWLALNGAPKYKNFLVIERDEEVSNPAND